MASLPQRQPMTKETARNTPLRTLLDRIESFRRDHPGIRVSAPYSNSTGQWETYSADAGIEHWTNGRQMIETLEQRDQQWN
jgi:vacuolar-type H+-ATPase catalytic subunit A/Vma1